MSINIDEEAPLAFKGISVEGLMDLIDQTSTSIGGGAGPDEIWKDLKEKGIGSEGADIIFDICMTRKNASSKFPDLGSPFFTSEGLRWATPQLAADHCADRLGRDLVMDITCGQGGQVLSLARTCDRVVAFDLDPLNCLLTRMNAISMGLDNVEVLNVDCLSDRALYRAEKGCAVFSDPSRPPGAAERSMDEVLPDPRKVEGIYRSKVDGFCFEVPPYLSLDKVPFDCEAEYVSIDGRINRLNLYLGDLKKDDRSAVILPEGDRVAGSPLGRLRKIEDTGNLRFMNEVDPALVKADLIELLIIDLDGRIERMDLDKRRTMLLSAAPISSPFIKDSFKILGRSKDLHGVKRLLVDVDARSVTLRFPVEPSEYWNVRNGLEKELSGTIKTQLFKGDDHILTSKIEKRGNS